MPTHLGMVVEGPRARTPLTCSCRVTVGQLAQQNSTHTDRVLGSLDDQSEANQDGARLQKEHTATKKMAQICMVLVPSLTTPIVLPYISFMYPL